MQTLHDIWRLARPAAAALLLSSCASSTPAPPPTPVPPNTSGWWRGKVVYEVFVRSFADSDGDGVGDFKGLTAKIPRLGHCPGVAAANTLGVDALWLMPIHPTPSYHGYDVTDYRAVNPQYGTEADFDALVAEAHRCGVKVVLDMVLNHSSGAHPWFVDSASSPSSPKRGWYVWSDTATSPGWTRPVGSGMAWYLNNGAWYYAVFSYGMPDLNLANPAVEAELVASMKSWLARGVDGFRLDAVPYYIETGPGAGQVNTQATHDFLKRVRRALQLDAPAYPDALLVAEAWQPPDVVASYYGAGDEVQLAFTFDLAARLVSGAAAGNSGDAMNGLYGAEASLGAIDRGFQAPFLTNHDQVRLMRRVGGDAGAARVAAAALFAMAGTPFVYYGEELGMQGGPASDDREKRTVYHWNGTSPGYGFTAGTPWYGDTTEAAGTDLETQRADPASLWNHYRSLIALRHAQPALSGGDVVPLAAAANVLPAPMAVVRSAGGKRVLFVANFATTPSGAFSVSVTTPPGATGGPSLLLGEGLDTPPSVASATISFSNLKPRGFAFLALE